MSGVYNSIPRDRREQYLLNAEAAIIEATEPVVAILGNTAISSLEEFLKNYPKLTVLDAQRLTKEDAKACEVGDEAEQYVQDHDMQKIFAQELEEPLPTVGDQAEAFLNAMLATDKVKAHMEQYGSINPVVKTNYGITYLTDSEHKALRELDSENKGSKE